MAVKVGLFVRLEAASGKEGELEQFLVGARQLVEQEDGTTVWYAVKFGPSTFGIFDAFEAEEGRQAHLNGAVAQADPSATPPYNLGPEWPTFPVEQTMGNGSNMYTAAVRQYGPVAQSDGHFVAFQVPSAVEDVRHFLGQAALGMTPAVGR